MLRGQQFGALQGGNLIRERAIADISGRQQLKRRAMPWSDGGEVPIVQGNHDLSGQSLGEGNHRGVRASQGEAGILLNQVANARPILWSGGFDVKVPKATEEGSLGSNVWASADDIGRFGYNEGRYDEMEIRLLEHLQRTDVIFISDIGDRVERTGVNDREHFPILRRGYVRCLGPCGGGASFGEGSTRHKDFASK